MNIEREQFKYRLRRTWPFAVGLILCAIALVLFLCSGCAPTAEEWQQAYNMPEGTVAEMDAKIAELKKLKARKDSEDAQLNWLLVIGAVVGGAIPGAGAAVRAYAAARKAKIERDQHAAAGVGLVGQIDELLGAFAPAAQDMVIEWLKAGHNKLGIRDTVRQYLKVDAPPVDILPQDVPAAPPVIAQPLSAGDISAAPTGRYDPASAAQAAAEKAPPPKPQPGVSVIGAP